VTGGTQDKHGHGSPCIGIGGKFRLTGGNGAQRNCHPVQRQTVSKVDFSKIRLNKINDLQSPHTPKTGF
jgi:hypothetical protein